MIQIDIKKRITASDALKHSWFEHCIKHDKVGTVLNEEVVKKLREFKGSSKFKKAALNILVKMLNPKEIEDLREEF